MSARTPGSGAQGGGIGSETMDADGAGVEYPKIVGEAWIVGIDRGLRNFDGGAEFAAIQGH